MSNQWWNDFNPFWQYIDLHQFYRDYIDSLRQCDMITWAFNDDQQYVFQIKDHQHGIYYSTFTQPIYPETTTEDIVIETKATIKKLIDKYDARLRRY